MADLILTYSNKYPSIILTDGYRIIKRWQFTGQCDVHALAIREARELAKRASRGLIVELD